MDVSIIIVNYNTKDLIRDCIDSILKQTQDVEFEIIVSDNGSKDGSIEMIKSEFPNVVLIENNKNLGFGSANNRGLDVAKGKYIFYLNSDTILLNNAVRIFFDYWENASDQDTIGVLGTMLLDKDGKFNTSYGNLPTAKNEVRYLKNCFLSSIYIKYFYSKFFKVNRVKEYYGEVGYVMGADLFLKNNSDARFDERYFMFYEESDMQFQMKNKNKKSLLIKGPLIMHLEGGSDKRNKLVYNFNKATSHYYWDSCIKYLQKNANCERSIRLIKFYLHLIYLLPWNIKFKLKKR